MLLILLKKESIILVLSKQVVIPICMIIDMVVTTRKKWLHLKRFQRQCEHAAILEFGSRYLIPKRSINDHPLLLSVHLAKAGS